MESELKNVNEMAWVKAVVQRDNLVPFLYLESRKTYEAAFVVRKTYKKKRYVQTIGTTEQMSLKAARIKALKINEEIENGKNLAAFKWTFQDAIEYVANWVKEYGSHNQKKYWSKDLSRFTNLSQEFRDTELTQINEKLIKRDLTNFKNTGVKNSTVNRLLSAISRVYRIIGDLGFNLVNPCLKIKRLAEHNIRTNVIPPELIKYYISSLLHDCNWLSSYALIIAVSTGIRIGNISSLTISMLSSCLDCIHLPMTKSGKPQTVAVPSVLKQLFQELLDNAKSQSSSFLFPSRTSSTGHISSPRGAHERALNSLQKHGYTLNCTIHDLRRTFANQLLRASNNNVYLVSQALGHGSVDVTMRYLSIRSSELDEAVNLASAALGLDDLAA